MRSLAITLLAVVVSSAAHAQVDCPLGLVPVDASHCCRSGQTFSPESQTCIGEPLCPKGFVANGESCAVPGLLDPTLDRAPAPTPGIVGFLVHFQPEEVRDDFTVSVDGGPACKAPCDLSVVAGYHRVAVGGKATYEERIEFPAAPSVVKIGMRHSGRMALGIVGLSVGIPIAVAGLIVLGVLSGTDKNSDAGEGIALGAILAWAVTVQGLCIAGALGGVGFGTMGREQLRLESSASPQREGAPLKLVSLGAAPTRGGAMLGATFTF